MLMPFKDKVTNYINLFNEATLVIISVILPFFIEIAIGKNLHNGIGWFLCVLLGANILINIGVIMIVKGIEACKSVR